MNLSTLLPKENVSQQQIQEVEAFLSLLGCQILHRLAKRNGRYQSFDEAALGNMQEKLDIQKARLRGNLNEAQYEHLDSVADDSIGYMDCTGGKVDYAIRGLVQQMVLA